MQRKRVMQKLGVGQQGPFWGEGRAQQVPEGRFCFSPKISSSDCPWLNCILFNATRQISGKHLSPIYLRKSMRSLTQLPSFQSDSTDLRELFESDSSKKTQCSDWLNCFLFSPTRQINGNNNYSLPLKNNFCCYENAGW